MLASSLLALAATLTLALPAAAQQEVLDNDGNKWTCPTVRTVEVAYVSYCMSSGDPSARPACKRSIALKAHRLMRTGPATSRTNQALLGTSSIGHFSNAPTDYNQAPGGFQLICTYPNVSHHSALPAGSGTEAGQA